MRDFQPGTALRPARDQTFVVGDQHFSIPVMPALEPGFPGFGATQTPNLPNPEGAYVRIAYVDDKRQTILRVEAKR